MRTSELERGGGGVRVWKAGWRCENLSILSFVPLKWRKYLSICFKFIYALRIQFLKFLVESCAMVAWVLFFVCMCVCGVSCKKSKSSLENLKVPSFLEHKVHQVLWHIKWPLWNDYTTQNACRGQEVGDWSKGWWEVFLLKCAVFIFASFLDWNWFISSK